MAHRLLKYCRHACALVTIGCSQVLNVTIYTSTAYLIKESTLARLVSDEFLITAISSRAALLVAGEVEQRVLVRAEFRLDGSATLRVHCNRCNVRREEALAQEGLAGTYTS